MHMFVHMYPQFSSQYLMSADPKTGVGRHYRFGRYDVSMRTGAWHINMHYDISARRVPHHLLRTANTTFVPRPNDTVGDAGHAIDIEPIMNALTKTSEGRDVATAPQSVTETGDSHARLVPTLLPCEHCFRASARQRYFRASTAFVPALGATLLSCQYYGLP